MNVLFSFKQLRTLLAMLAMMISGRCCRRTFLDNQGPGRRALSGTDKHEPTIFASPS